MARPTANSRLTLQQAIDKYDSKYIENLYSQDISMDQLATKLNISRATCYNLLKYFKIAYRTNIQSKYSLDKLTAINLTEFKQFLYNFGATATWQHYHISRKYFYNFCKLHQIDYHDTKCIQNKAKLRKQIKIEKIGAEQIHNAIVDFGYMGAKEYLSISRSLLDFYIKNYDKDILKYAKNKNSNNSIYNIRFQKKLEASNVNFVREFSINKKRFDFLINNCLIELNPARTHNLDGADSRYKALPFFYHQQKSLLALKNGFTIMHLFPWCKFETLTKQKHTYSYYKSATKLIVDINGTWRLSEILALLKELCLKDKINEIILSADLNYCSSFINKPYTLVEPTIYYYDDKLNKLSIKDNSSMNIYRMADAGRICWQLELSDLEDINLWQDMEK